MTAMKPLSATVFRFTHFYCCIRDAGLYRVIMAIEIRMPANLSDDVQVLIRSELRERLS